MYSKTVVFERVRKPWPVKLGPVLATIALAIALATPDVASATRDFQKGITIDLFAGPVWGKGGATSVFDRYRQVRSTLAGGQKLTGGIRFGFDISKYFTLGLTIKGVTNDQSVGLYDSRTYDPSYPDDYWLLIENTEMPLFLGEVLFRPIDRWYVPYASVGAGVILIEPGDTNARAVSAGTGVILYPIRNLGFRFEARYTRCAVSGLVSQSSPPRMIPYSDRLTFSEISAGIVVRIFSGRN